MEVRQQAGRLSTVLECLQALSCLLPEKHGTKLSEEASNASDSAGIFKILKIRKANRQRAGFSRQWANQKIYDVLSRSLIAHFKSFSYGIRVSFCDTCTSHVTFKAVNTVIENC